MRIVVMPAAVVSAPAGATTTLKDVGMLWLKDGTVWMTQEAWDNYQRTCGK